MRQIKTLVVPVTTTGTAGAATGSAVSDVVTGWVEEVFLDFNGSAPATTDTTLAFTDRGGNILAVANSATDLTAAPRAKPVDNANAVITGASTRFCLENQSITVSVAQSNALAPAVTAYIKVEVL